MKLKKLFSIGVAAFVLATVTALLPIASLAQTTNVQNLLPPLPPGTIPAGASLPAFNTNGLDFTNALYKFANGSHFDSSGGVLTYLQADADLYQTTSVSLGIGANATLSGSGTGLHSAAGFGELIKNFSNFQFVAKAGAGGVLDNPTFYGAEVAEINYNLTSGTAGILANNHLFTFVGANVEADEENFRTGGKFQKQFNIYMGVAF